jgi:hypothetical protein
LVKNIPQRRCSTLAPVAHSGPGVGGSSRQQLAAPNGGTRVLAFRRDRVLSRCSPESV